MQKFLRNLSRKQKSLVFLAIDTAQIPVALFFTFLILPGQMPVSAQMSDSLPMLFFVMMFGVGVSRALGLPLIVLNDYERHAIGLTALFALFLSAASASLSAFAGLSLSLGTHVVFGFSYFAFAVAGRVVLHKIVNMIYSIGEPPRPVLIYGAGTTGTQLAQALSTHDSIQPIAFVDDNTSLQRVRLSGLPVYAPTKIAHLAEKHGIRRVLLAMPSLTTPKQAQIARRLQAMGLEVQTLPSFAQLIGEEELVDKLAPIEPQDFLGRTTRDVPLGDAYPAYAGRSILVTGAGGSIGSELCRQVLGCRPSRLVLFDISELSLYRIESELQQLVRETGSQVELVAILGSVTDARLVRRVLTENGIQIVLHAAAYKHVPLVEANALVGLENNVMGTRVLAREAAAQSIERFTLISSDKAVRPTNVMGASKRLAELVVQDLDNRSNRTIFSMVRFGNVLGSSGSVVPLFESQIRRGGPVTVTDPDVKRFFMTLREAVTLVLKAGAAARGGEVFVLDMGEPVSILTLAEQMIEHMGYSVRDEARPNGDIEIQITGLRPGEKMTEELTLTGSMTPTRFQKIFCVHETGLNDSQIETVLRDLRGAIADGDEATARALIAKWVESPEPSEKRPELS